MTIQLNRPLNARDSDSPRLFVIFINRKKRE